MKKKLLCIAALAVAALTSVTSYAQVSSYTFTQSVGSYGAPNSGSLVGTVLQDDDVTNVPLPFNFTYNGSSYSSINVCSNGYLSFTALSGQEYLSISDGSTQEVLAPFSQDLLMTTLLIGDLTQGSNVITNVSSTNGIAVGDSLFDFNFDFGGYSPTVTAISGNNITVNLASQNTAAFSFLPFMNGSIRASVSGVAPNRVFEIQYNNMSRLFVFDEVLKFKVKLYETSNKIEFVYGAISPGFDQLNSEVGLKGTLPNDFNSRTVPSGSSWSSSLPAVNITDDCDFSFMNFPAPGLTYAWSPLTCVAPTLNVTYSSPNVCAGQSATITASGAPSYSWSTGTSSAQVVVTPSATTNYTVTGIDGACTSSLVVTQSITPVPTLSLNPASKAICTGNSAQLSASGASTYSWSNGAQSASISVSPTTNTTYVVTGSDLGCSSSQTVTLTVSACTGIDEQQGRSKLFSVYPNPSSGSFVIKTNSSESDRLLTIYNLLGAKVYAEHAADQAEIHVNVSLPEGVYYVELSGNSSKEVKQIVITN